MKKMIAVMAVMSCASASHAITQVQDGLLNDPTTWGGVLPGPMDSLLNEGWNLDVTTPYTTTGSFQTYGGDTEITASGSVTAYLQHLNGGVTVDGGSLESVGGGLVTFGQVGSTTMSITNGGNVHFDGQVVCGNGNLFTMNYNDGTVVADQWFLLKDAALNLNSGSSLTVLQQLAFEGTAAGNVFVHSNTTLTVDWVHFQAAGTSEEKITVDGGIFTVVADNAAGSLIFEGANAVVQFDAGSIVWQGVDNQGEFDAFTNTFNGWVDAGRITSTTFTPEQLKQSLVFDGFDAVLHSEFASFTGVLHVATNGNDSWSGTVDAPTSNGLDGPLATLIGARNSIRTYREEGYSGPVEVLVRGGVYYESPTLELEPQDSGMAGAPVTYKAYPGETPVISGGRLLPSLSSGQYSVYIPQAWGRQWAFRQLFIDDVRYTLARSPNQGYYYVQDIPPEPASPYYGEPYWSSHNFIYSPGDLKNWSTLSDGDINLRVYSLWEAGTLLLTSVDESDNTAFTETHMLFGYDPHDVIHVGGISKRYVVENAPDSLDAPGEWYLDRDTGVLTIIPFDSEDLSGRTLVAPVTQQAVKVLGDTDAGNFVEHIRFEDIAFKHYATPVLNGGMNGGWRTHQAASTIDSCIDIAGGKFIEFIRCEVSHIGTHAIRFGRGCTANVVEQCHLHDLGGGGVYLGELVKIADGYDPGAHGATYGNTIYNNYIHDGGIIHQAAAGVIIGQSSDNLVAHNEIAHFNWSGMQIGWNWDASPTWTKNNRIEYNHIHDIGQNVSSDLGGIYTVGENLSTLVENNVIHDVYCWVEGNGRGIYTDENTSGVTFRNNLVYSAGAQCFGINYIRDITVSNNVFAMSYGKAPFLFGHGADKAAITKNIFYYYYGSIYGSNNDSLNPSWVSEMDYNLYWRVDGAPVAYTPWGSDFNTWKAESGLDANSLEANPMFADPESGDFSFTNTQNADAIGFVAVDWTQSGLEGAPEWVSLPDSFDRDSSYRVYYEEWPGYSFTPAGLDAVTAVDGFSIVTNGGQDYGALTYSRIKVPVDPDADVCATTNLLDPLGDWSSLTNVHSVVDDVITESVTVRDLAPVSSFDSRFYRLRSQ